MRSLPDANYLCSNSSYSTAAGGKWHTMGGECDSSGRCWHGNVFPNESHAFWAERFGEAKARFGSTRSSSLCLYVLSRSLSRIVPQ